MLFDTHVNLHGEIYYEDREEVIKRAHQNQVTHMLSICDKIENIDIIRKIVLDTPNMWRTVGCHPHYAKDHQNLTTADLVRYAEPEDVVAIGETGLDLHYGYSDLGDQKHCFRRHLEACQETGLPVVVHTREADDETGDMLEQAFAEKPFPILMHCYTSGQRLADRAIDLGAYFSVSGIITFKNAHDVREVTKSFPTDRVILETDCPYLAPVPHRGRRNEPAYLSDICQYFADFKDMSFDEVAELTTQNALRLFNRIGALA